MDSPLLAEHEGPAVEVANAGGRGPVVLACDHAAASLPVALGDLGLSREVLASHVAWDPGALGVARVLSRVLDAPLVATRFSRLALDVNREPDRADAMVAGTEHGPVPGNVGLDPEARAARVAGLYEPFHAALGAALAARPGAALVTVHSFTPVYRGVRREVELGLLHDADDRLARAMLGPTAARTGMRAALNEPYAPADGVTHTLVRHAIPGGRANVMIEVRSDLIADEAAEARVAEALAGAIAEGLAAIRAPAGGGA